MVSKLTPADYNELWDLTKSVYLTPRLRDLVANLLVERARLQHEAASAPAAGTLALPECPCGDSGKPGHPLVGKCRKGIGGV